MVALFVFAFPPSICFDSNAVNLTFSTLHNPFAKHSRDGPGGEITEIAPMNFLQGSHNARIEHMVNYNVEGNLYPHVSLINPEQRRLCDILQPITDASHTRDRKRSPPDSSCFRGTRLQVVNNVNSWAKSEITTAAEPHVRWMHGYVGSGKSSISQEVCDRSEREDRPVISFFFFRNAGDRGRIWRLATTLASQMASVIPQAEPFIREAVQANPALLMQDEGGVSLQARMQCLVYAPFKAVVRKKKRVRALTQGPFLIVLDGLDECENKDEVQEFIDGMLEFFNENPLIPLRVFITSRVEQHIQSRLNVPAVKLDNLADHCSNDDIATFLDTLFEDGCRRNPVVRAYVQQHGEWPTQSDRRKLVEHIGGSFIFASVVFKFIMATNTEANDPPTPMDRLPLTLEMNPGLDGLYTQTLARSKHLPHFPDIVSTIALLGAPLPTSGIAELLGIHTYEVVNALMNLQAIIQVPGTDSIPVTFCHTSLRDFLTSPSRSGGYFAHPSHHVRLFLRCLECQLKHLRQDPELFIRSRDSISTVAQYALGYSNRHLYHGRICFKLSDFNSAIHLCREGLALQPSTPELMDGLAEVVRQRAHNTRNPMDWDEAISLYRAALELRPFPHPSRLDSLNTLGRALMDRYQFSGTMANLEEAISVYREVLPLQPSSHPNRLHTLFSLGNALLGRHWRTGNMADLEEAVSLHREALELRPLPNPDRSFSLTGLGSILADRHRCTGNMADLEEAISLHREAVELLPPLHPYRIVSLTNLGDALMDRHRRTATVADLEEAISLFRKALEFQAPPHLERSLPLNKLVASLQVMYEKTRALSHLQEAIAHCEELLQFYYTVGHRRRAEYLLKLGSLLQMRFNATRQEEDLSRLATLKEEVNRLTPSSPDPAP
ncbi:hypothetical protein EST38_g3234 [Candolleomyces aberdarensis]|uniref:Nephrocystin 3-like N-terminal domain-containing protein n=1 Tax=Candolleomyces aberdarensis TaxID=2316362 RepID=A0A4Q2DTI6_9AGAR|nr:hypothetical protein EST38_g3234 [Candolleomyces aberdarensis]